MEDKIIEETPSKRKPEAPEGASGEKGEGEDKLFSEKFKEKYVNFNELFLRFSVFQLILFFLLRILLFHHIHQHLVAVKGHGDDDEAE